MKGAKPRVNNIIPMKGDFAGTVPDVLDWMSEDGRGVWRELAPHMVQKKRLEPHFFHPFAAYCESVADFMRFTGDLAAFGTYYEVKTRNGLQQKKRAVWGQRQEALSTMNQLAARFGMTPVDEARLSTGGQGDLFANLKELMNGIPD